ncbi:MULTISPECIES: hypothetical protein [unclassified Polaromonas]|uniref:hypothetical protein n=1 Tax=unclassified Polaromonas TaxID=2638319 RepID=UPI00129E295E|nr:MULTISPECIES: hypothetical protein [unclassified Polaromonas]QGJ20009.1 hypothetical protein F7R28_17515 [Polaromonas sp. Pch-P]
MTSTETLGVIACRCVVNHSKPVLFVSHAGGDWQMYCRAENHDFNDAQAMKRDLVTVHLAHLVAMDPTLHAVIDLPLDMGAERMDVGGQWTRFRDADDE